MPPRRGKENAAAANACAAPLLVLTVTAGPCKGAVFDEQARRSQARSARLSLQRLRARVLPRRATLAAAACAPPLTPLARRSWSGGASGAGPRATRCA
jgi:hypothetical protein